MRKFYFVLALMILVFGSQAMAGDISGNWKIDRTGPHGAESIDAVITANGNTLTITGKHTVLGEIRGKGTITGNAVQMHIYADTTKGELDVLYEGTVDGNTMKGNSSTVALDKSKIKEGVVAAAGTEPGGGAQGGAQGGAPGAGQGGAPSGGAPGAAPGGAQVSGAPGGSAPQGGAPAGAMPEGDPDKTFPGQLNLAWTAVKK